MNYRPLLISATFILFFGLGWWYYSKNNEDAIDTTPIERISTDSLATDILSGSEPDKAPKEVPLKDLPPIETVVENDPDCVKPDSIMRIAKILQQYEWSFDHDMADSCGTKISFFRKDKTYKGVAYKWGGMDGIKNFEALLLEGKKPGSYSNEGVIACATGIDCSGFISFVWGIRGTKYGTSTIHQIAVDLDSPEFEMEKDMRRGDALNLPGNHIVLFDTLASNGNAIIYEATGGRIRKVRRVERDWNWFKDKGYKAIRYEKVCL